MLWTVAGKLQFDEFVAWRTTQNSPDTGGIPNMATARYDAREGGAASTRGETMALSMTNYGRDACVDIAIAACGL